MALQKDFSHRKQAKKLYGKQQNQINGISTYIFADDKQLDNITINSEAAQEAHKAARVTCEHCESSKIAKTNEYSIGILSNSFIYVFQDFKYIMCVKFFKAFVVIGRIL